MKTKYVISYVMGKRVKFDLSRHPTLWGERQTTLSEWGFDAELKDAKRILETVFSTEELQEIEIMVERCVWDKIAENGDLPDSNAIEGIGVSKGKPENSMWIFIIGSLEVLEKSLAHFLLAARLESQYSILLRLHFSRPENYEILLRGVSGFGLRYTLKRMGFD